MKLTESEKTRLDRIEFECKLAVFPDECKEWLCTLVRRLDMVRTMKEQDLMDEIEGLENREDELREKITESEVEVNQYKQRIEELVEDLINAKKKVKR
mgnify:CR=1 FL=1